MSPTLDPPAALDRHPVIDDLQAIDEVTRGNREMFEVLVRRYNQQLFRVGIAYLRNHEQAEDAMQNAYLKAFLNLSHFHRASSFSTWITRIMINECLMTLRRRRRAAEESLETAPEPNDPTASYGAAGLNLKEMKMLLEATIAKLPRKFRAVYMLREVQLLTTAETSAALGLSPENVKVTLHRARERLKADLLNSAAGVELFPYLAPFCDPLTARVMSAILAVA
jgi:RNA polymerase sigma-70 factor (ECF subfamily)